MALALRGLKDHHRGINGHGLTTDPITQDLEHSPRHAFAILERSHETLSRLAGHVAERRQATGDAATKRRGIGTTRRMKPIGAPEEVGGIPQAYWPGGGLATGPR